MERNAYVYNGMACEMTTDSSCNSKHGDSINCAWQTSARLSYVSHKHRIEEYEISLIMVQNSHLTYI